MKYYCKIVMWMEIEKSKVLIKFLLNFRQSGDVLFFLNVRRLRGYTATLTFSKCHLLIAQLQQKKCHPSCTYNLSPNLKSDVIFELNSFSNEIGDFAVDVYILFDMNNDWLKQQEITNLYHQVLKQHCWKQINSKSNCISECKKILMDHVNCSETSFSCYDVTSNWRIIQPLLLLRRMIIEFS